jgi:hypothetical protein
MIITIIILVIFVLGLYVKVVTIENALSNHLDEPSSEAHPEYQKTSSFEDY